MAEVRSDVKEEHKEEKKKGLFGKVKSAIVPDAEEQAAIISTMVRITVLGWSGAILTLNYVSYTWYTTTEDRSDIYSLSFHWGSGQLWDSNSI